MTLEDAVSAFRYGANAVLSVDRQASYQDDHDAATILLRKMRHSMHSGDWDRFVELVNAADDAESRSPR